MSDFKKISSETIQRNPWWNYKHDRYILPNGSEGDYYYGEKIGGAIIIPVTSDGRLILVRQYRYLQNKFSVEFPMGAIDGDETPLEAAKRELLEETKQVSSEFIHVGMFEPSNGLFKDPMHVFVATTLSPGNALSADPTESIEVMYRRIDEFEDMIRRNEIWDGETLAAWTLARPNLVAGTMPNV